MAMFISSYTGNISPHSLEDSAHTATSPAVLDQDPSLVEMNRADYFRRDSILSCVNSFSSLSISRMSSFAKQPSAGDMSRIPDLLQTEQQAGLSQRDIEDIVEQLREYTKNTALGDARRRGRLDRHRSRHNAGNHRSRSVSRVTKSSGNSPVELPAGFKYGWGWEKICKSKRSKSTRHRSRGRSADDRGRPPIHENTCLRRRSYSLDNTSD
ncbi:hypothetical protein V1511DRAFT_494110 [Dipodascopsis uninucleata]